MRVRTIRKHAQLDAELKDWVKLENLEHSEGAPSARRPGGRTQHLCLSLLISRNVRSGKLAI
jgi:hypothetical protein